MTPEEREARRKQYNAVWRCMVGGAWWTLEEIQKSILASCGLYAPLQSISARLRDFRKKEHGAHTVHRFQVSDKPRLFKYRLERRVDETP